MNYSEAAFFDHNHCQHVADYHRELSDRRVRSKIAASLRASRHFLFDTTGATSIEYGLLAGLIAGSLIFLSAQIGHQLGDTLHKVSVAQNPNQPVYPGGNTQN